MSCKELRRAALLRGLACDRLGAVFAELEGLALSVGVGPGAAGAVEAVLLVQLRERADGAREPGVAERVVKGLVDGGKAGGVLLARFRERSARFERGLGACDPVREVRVLGRRQLAIGLTGGAVLIVLVLVHCGAVLLAFLAPG